MRPSTPDDGDAKIRAALAKLSEKDRRIALEQQFCPVLTHSRLGSMGVPVKLTVKGQPVFICCASCKDKALEHPEQTLAEVAKFKEGKAVAVGEEAKFAADLAKLSPKDRRLAETQRFCAVQGNNRLGSMGVPDKVMVQGEPVFLCCEACREEALATSPGNPGAREETAWATESGEVAQSGPPLPFGRGVRGEGRSPRPWIGTSAGRRSHDSRRLRTQAPPLTPSPSPQRGEGERVTHDRKHHRSLDPQSLPRAVPRGGADGAGRLRRAATRRSTPSPT